MNNLASASVQSTGAIQGIVTARRAIVLLLLVAATYWLWVGLTQRSIVGDDGGSIIVAEGIVEHGYQLIPSGYLYHRGYVPHYLLAGAISVFGVNDLSIMLPSLLLALGVLLITYLFGRDILRRPWVGVAAAALLVTLQLEAFYATNPRMYMSAQFFTMLAVYGAWRGYVQGEARFQFVMFLAISAALLSHRQAATLVIALPVSVVAVMWIRDRRIPSPLPYLTVATVIGTLLVGVVGYFLFAFKLPDAMPLIAQHGGHPGGWVGLNADPVVWAKHVYRLESALPFGLPFVAILAFLAIRSLWRRTTVDLGSGYLLLGFAISALLVMAVIQIPEHRFWVFILPLYALLVCAGGDAAIRAMGRDRVELSYGAQWILVGLLGAGLAASVGLAVLARGPSFAGLVKEGYGVPCHGTQWRGRDNDRPSPCSANIEAQYARFRHLVKPDDVVISSNPPSTQYYLRKVDGFLRERRADGGFTEFEEPADEFHGLPLIDSIGELQGIVDGSSRVWVITDFKAKSNSSEEMLSFLEDRFETHLQDQYMTTYVSCLEPPCRVTGAASNPGETPGAQVATGSQR